MHLFAGIALVLRRTDRTVSLSAELAPALSSRSAEVPREQGLASQRISEYHGQNR